MYFLAWGLGSILISEGKHYLSSGKKIIKILKSKKDLLSYLNDKKFYNELIDLLNKESNYEISENSGIVHLKESLDGISKVKHLPGSYTLAIEKDSDKELTFESNVKCAEYFDVTKVSVGRWINRGGYVKTEKGIFCFYKKAKKKS